MKTAMADEIEVQQFPLWDKLRTKRAPFGFDLELTARCNNDCRRCTIVSLCLHCPAHAHLETGAMDGATPYLCAVAHARAAAIAGRETTAP